ncbi:hypothetical protein [Clostridium tarantellae]|uniref:hypothetical protein n=1 Tax=Clostridium tarantellae TaxID=39493 RepID=UPI001478A3A8|nr:hypothetical protein [Clostridium tarantellae]
MKKNTFICLYCNKFIDENYFNSNIGVFCNKNHYEEYIKSLSDKEYIHIMHKFCT